MFFKITNTPLWQHSRLANLPRCKSHALGTLDFRFSEKDNFEKKNPSYNILTLLTYLLENVTDKHEAVCFTKARFFNTYIY